MINFLCNSETIITILTKCLIIEPCDLPDFCFLQQLNVNNVHVHRVTKFWAKSKEIIFEDACKYKLSSCLTMFQICRTLTNSNRFFFSPVLFRGVDCKFHSTVFTGFYCRLTYRYLTHQGL